MKRLPVLSILLVVAAAAAVFYLVIHHGSRTWLSIGLRPEVRDALAQSLEDQRKLRDLDQENSETYRRRFEENRKLTARLDILMMNREAVRRRIEAILVTTFAVTLLASAFIWLRRQRLAETRERQAFASRLASNQQAARRHAHEIRTPLAAARLEVERLLSLAGANASQGEIERAGTSVFEELDRLARFTREFTSFATVGQPVLQPASLDREVAEFCQTFATAWKNLDLVFTYEGPAVPVSLDRDLFRQVLANLCANSSHAIVGRGTMMFSIEREGKRVILDVTDNGSGVPASVRPQIFDPYVTTRGIGEGMGLGLAIARKILLDHGGDLVLAHTSGEGTTFRITFPSPAPGGYPPDHR